MDGETSEIQASLANCGLEHQVAIASMLVAAAIRDGEFAHGEEDKILQLLGEAFQLQLEDARNRLDAAVTRIIKTTSLSVLLGDLRYHLSLTQKQEALLMLLKVIAADGRQTAEEIDLISQASENLKLSREATHEVFNRYFAEHQAQA